LKAGGRATSKNLKRALVRADGNNNTTFPSDDDDGGDGEDDGANGESGPSRAQEAAVYSLGPSWLTLDETWCACCKRSVPKTVKSIKSGVRQILLQQNG
jgi:hypothetical protein